ncbi:MAG: TerB family tellurite resistance protein [Phycisphaerales bacterium]
MLSPTEAESIAAIALMAALADGRTGSEEREQLRSLFDALGAEHDLPALPALYQKVLLKQVGLGEAAAALTSDESRRMAFEMGVCIADADGKATPAEQAFLDQLENALGIHHAEAVSFERQADALAEAPIDAPSGADARDATLDPDALLGPIPLELEPQPRAASSAPAAPAPITQPADRARRLGVDDALTREIDASIMKYSILNGALELLPQNLATMAILPLQTRMVYTIGKRYGYTLGPGHIKEFIATLGMGATSQMLENFARKALGKLAKKALGKTAGGLVKAATGPMMTFAATYAIGQVANAYYSKGRQISTADLRGLFQNNLARGKALFEQNRAQVDSSARSLDPAKVLDLVRGKATL